MKFSRLLCACFLAVLCDSTASWADPILLDSGSNVLRGGAYGDATDTAVGYKFSLGSSQTVTAFGLYDAANSAGNGFQGDGLLSTNNEINLWRVADQVLLAISAPLPQSGADASGFIYQSMFTPMNGFTGTLIAGTEYIVTARYNVVSGISQGPNVDAFRNSGGAGGPTLAAGVSVGPGQFSGTGAFYQFPGNLAGVGFVGPNIQAVSPNDVWDNNPGGNWENGLNWADSSTPVNSVQCVYRG